MPLTGGAKGSRWRLLFYPCIVGVVGIAAGIVFWLLDPVAFRLAVFQPVRELTFFARELEVVTHWRDIKAMTVPQPRAVSIVPTSTNHNDLTIVADLWRPQRDGKAAALILLHGSSPWGRKNGLIQLLAHFWYEKGWVVLAPDAKGFGETDDPPDIDNPDAWTVQQDITRIINYVATLEGVDASRIYLFGHSMGAGHALEGALHDERVRTLILVSTPWFGQDTGVPDVPISRWERARFSADRRLSSLISGAVLQRSRPRAAIAPLAIGSLSQPEATEIVLIDGKRESSAKREFFRNLTQQSSPPIPYLILEGAGHYCGVYNFFGSDTVYYRPELFQKLLDAMAEYLEG